METNHTRIYGVSHCPPLSEQPTTSKPSAFLGYIPETTPTLPVVLQGNSPPLEDLNQNTKSTQTDLTKVKYEIETNQGKKGTLLDQPIAVTLQQSNTDPNLDLHNKSVLSIPEQKIFAEQGQRINELASEIEELRTRIDKLSNQNQLLLDQQLQKNITELRKP